MHVRGSVRTYKAGVLTDTSLHQAVSRLEQAISQKEKVFDNISFAAIITAYRERGLARHLLQLA